MRILVECYPDEALLRALGVPKKQLRHERCKGEVVKRVLKFDKTIGLIDEDPGSTQPRDLNNYRVVKTAKGLCLLTRQDDTNKRIIVICPRLEDWLLLRAKSMNIDPTAFGLPAQPHHLHSLVRYDRRDGFQRFLAELKERDDGMKLLRQWVSAR